MQKKYLFLIILIGFCLLLTGCDDLFSGVISGKRTGSVNGRVVNYGLNPIQGVTVAVSGKHGTTDKDGLFRIGDLEVGTYSVVFSHEGFNTKAMEIFVKEGSNSLGDIIMEEGEQELSEGQTSHTTPKGLTFKMRLASAATFPTGIDDSCLATVDHDFWIAETQVTYELWFEVRVWAEGEGFTFANEGREGSKGNFGEEPSERKKEPVTNVSWYDSIVWCNAVSKYLGYDPVYTIDGEVLRDAEKLIVENAHENVVAENNNGFRLPTSNEWELAARYKGTDSSYGAIEYPKGSNHYWTPGNYASGASDDYSNEGATKAVAWYGENSFGKTQDVGQKPEKGNGLGVYDMSGNVWEWCFSQLGFEQVVRGGSWLTSAFSMSVGRVRGFDPFVSGNGDGLRIVKTD